MQELGRLGAARLHLSHVRDVEHAGAPAHGQMLLADALVLDRHLPAGKRDEPRPSVPMLRVEGGSAEGRLGCRAHKRRLVHGTELVRAGPGRRGPIAPRLRSVRYRSLRNDGMSISSSPISSDERWRSSIVTSRSRRALARGLAGRARARVAVIETGRDDGDPDLIAHRVVDDRPEDDVRVGVGRALDDLSGLVDLEQAEVVAAGDVEQDAHGALDRLLEQRRGDGDLGRLGGRGSRRWRYRCPSAPCRHRA